MELPIQIEFIIFGLTLLGVAAFHHKTMQVAVTGLTTLTLYKFLFTDFSLLHHLGHEWQILVNLLGLLLGFTILADYFEKSEIPALLPHLLPDDWKGGFVLLLIVTILSSFLDNIAAAMIGGAVAGVVFQHKIHIGYLAAIVAASNAGGAGSVLGDTTTTMMWIDGVSAFDVTHAFVGSIVAFCIFGTIASRQQHAFQPILRDDIKGAFLHWRYIFAVFLILTGAIITNVTLEFPALGIWAAIILCISFCKTDWSILPPAFKGSVFLLSLVLSASMMPVESLPTPTWMTTLGLGFLSAIFDNIPLTKLALEQGGYDWGFLAFAVGYGGSMIWFGSSAGVAISNLYPDARSVTAWIKGGWHIIIGYVVGFFAMLWLVGWHPHPSHKESTVLTPINEIHSEIDPH